MTIHIGEISNQVNVATGDLPLSETQLQRLVELVIKQLEQREHDDRQRRQDTRMRRQAAPGQDTED